MNLLFLGAATHQVYPIIRAKKFGHKIFTADNLINNPGHKFSDKSFNVDVKDLKSLEKIIVENKIDRVHSFGSDIGYKSSNILNSIFSFPCNPVETIEILTNKKKFRKFCFENLNQDLLNKTFKDPQKAEEFILDKIKKYNKLVVKPVDSNGSKGVFIVSERDDIKYILNESFLNSSKKEIIIEEYIQRQGPQICGDGFYLNNKIVFIHYGDGYFYDSHTCPYAETFPSTHPNYILKKVTNNLETILNKLKFKFGIFNFDVIVKKNREIFVNEIGPRSGGNFIPEIIDFSTGFSLIDAELNLISNFKKIKFIKKYNFPFGGFMLHSNTEGILKEIIFSKKIEKLIVSKNIFIPINSKVNRFLSSKDYIGNVILKFESFDHMKDIFEKIEHFIKIKIL